MDWPGFEFIHEADVWPNTLGPDMEPQGQTEEKQTLRHGQEWTGRGFNLFMKPMYGTIP